MRCGGSFISDLRSLTSAAAVSWLVMAGGAGGAWAQTGPGGPRSADAVSLETGARVVIERHCAGCHQAEQSPAGLPQGGIGDILSLGGLVRAGVLVKPGLPEASPLFTVLYTGHAPHRILARRPGGEPGVDEVAAVRDWIASLGEDREAAACRERPRLGASHAPARAAQAVEAADPARRIGLRFVSLAHLVDGCRSAQEISSFTQAVTWLVNAASRAPAPVVLRAVDAEGAVLALDLEQLGWSAQAWEALTASFALAGLPPFDIGAEAGRHLGSRRAIVSADWLAAALAGPDAYGAVLGLPAQRGGLAQWLGAEAGAGGRAVRIERPLETRAAREVSRSGADGRSVWETTDKAESGAAGPSWLAFALPNGFTGFAAYGADGARLEPGSAPPSVVGHGGHAASSAAASTACLSCHAIGPRLMAPAEHPLVGAADADRARWARTAAEAGIDPALRVGGRDPVGALAAVYQGSVSLPAAAAEVGLTPRQLAQQLGRMTGRAVIPARRLLQGAVTRNEALEVYAALLEGGPAAGAVTVSPESGSGSQPRLALWADADSYGVGQALTLHAAADRACHLTVINVDVRGRATVLFPNGFEPDNVLEAGKPITVPGRDGPYRLRLSERGRETMIGICTASALPVDGIRHDFERLQFTVLGDWASFQIRAYEDVGKPAPPIRERRQVRRRGQPERKPEVLAPRGSEPQSRTAFTLEVR